MKFIKIINRRGQNYDHGTKYTVTDVQRSNGLYNFEAGVNRMPRRDSKYWRNTSRFMIWDVKRNQEVRRYCASILGRTRLAQNGGGRTLDSRRSQNL